MVRQPLGSRVDASPLKGPWDWLLFAAPPLLKPPPCLLPLPNGSFMCRRTHGEDRFRGSHLMEPPSRGLPDAGQQLAHLNAGRSRGQGRAVSKVPPQGRSGGSTGWLCPQPGLLASDMSVQAIQHPKTVRTQNLPLLGLKRRSSESEPMPRDPSVGHRVA